MDISLLESVRNVRVRPDLDNVQPIGEHGRYRASFFRRVDAGIGVLASLWGAEMAFRIARGLFRLWVVGSILWIGVVGASTWRQFVFFEPVVVGKASLSSTANICSKATTSEQCFKLLEAAGRNPFSAFDLSWTDRGWSFPDDTKMQAEGVAWERLPVAIALGPPLLLLVAGWAFVWAFRGFR
jgi:hypothetical protein